MAKMTSQYDDITPPQKRSMTGKLLAIVVGLLFLGLVMLSQQIWEHVDAGESVIIQYPSGSIHIVTTPGYAWQLFGSVEHFRRSTQKSFDGNDTIKTRFNDGAHGYISGSIRYDMPGDNEQLLDLYRTYRTQRAIDDQLVAQNIMKAVYMTGPLMSSKESYSDRRNELISNIEDQAINGIYQTNQTMVEKEDPITQQKKWINVVEVRKDKNGKILRQEESPLQRFGIHLYNLTISEIKYDDVVEKQIAEQQQNIMQVQTAIAQSKRAEQQAQTAEQTGRADAAKAKWEQEVVKAKAIVTAEQEKEVAITAANKEKAVAVTAAERDREVADLAKQAAEFTKAQQIALGQGEAERKKLVFQANGALESKMDTWLKREAYWATAFGEFKGNIVPSIVTGGGAGTATTNSFQTFMDSMSAKALKDLSLDMSMSAAVPKQ